MKKVLVLTSIYPGPDIPKSFTPIVHYFAKEWIASGVEVKVIHNIAYYPRIFYWISYFFSKLISSIIGTNIPTKRLVKDYVYKFENVVISRYPMFKLFPQHKFTEKTLIKQKLKITRELKKDNFDPDFIVGHWWNPQLELIHMLKNEFSDSKTALIMHKDGVALQKLYKSKTTELLNSIDVFGYRSLPIKTRFESLFGPRQKSFLCYSGIPEEFIKHKISKKFSNKLNSFLYVGVMIKRKFPSEILDSLNDVYIDKSYKLEYIGEGYELKKIENRIIKYNLIENVVLNGKVSREIVWEKMLKADCFIMISENEAFGLVYLEAMAAGCITIASRNEGFDGVIKDGVNGFLCSAGNTKELSKILKKINALSLKQKHEISQNAINTARSLTNKKAAKRYLSNLN